MTDSRSTFALRCVLALIAVVWFVLLVIEAVQGSIFHGVFAALVAVCLFFAQDDLRHRARYLRS